MLRLIVVDDEKDARDLMVNCINQVEYGIEIIGSASDGPEAYRMIKEHDPDIVMMDIEIPGMSGLEVIRRIREDGMHTVFIIISSYNEFSYAQDAIRLNVEEYLLKPFLPAEFCDAVYRAAERIRSVRLLPYFAAPPAPKEQGVLRQAPFTPGRMPLVYPHQQERALAEALKLGVEEQVQDDLAAFFAAAKERNDNVASVTNCYIILYVEICHVVMNRGIELSSLDLQVPQFASYRLELFEKTLTDFCAEICRRFGCQSAPNTIVSRAMKHIECHFAEPLVLEDVAKQIYVSPSYLSSLFKQTVGISFTDYVQKVRIDNAKQLIVEQPYLKNYEISDLVGYTSVKYFSEVFKKLNGTTISRFRSQLGYVPPDADG